MSARSRLTGWALVIAMHGGGGAPKHVNDQQWQSMFKRYYKEHPEAGGYVYLALRAPNDEWNGFYDDAICPLVERLIRQFVLFGDVDPDRVYILGASHGGYGAFVIGPKMPDRFAAVHASAAAADRRRDARREPPRRAVHRHGRRQGHRLWPRRSLPGLHQGPRRLEGPIRRIPRRGVDPAGRRPFGARPRHGRRDAQVGRAHPRPDRLVWAMSDDVLKHFYWLEAPHPDPSGRIEASVRDNTITLKAEHQDEVALWLDAPLVNLARPVTIEPDGGRRQVIKARPNPETFCVGLEERGDPRLAAPARVSAKLKP